MSWFLARDDDERFLLDAFEDNFERLRVESGRSLAPTVKDAARQQVLLYWRRLRGLAEQVEETEVHLVLPDQRTPKGRAYTLEGVVDIVQDADRTVMYDLKTFLDADSARDAPGPYVEQLNVYAHIWEGLRGNAPDAVAVVATRPTRPVVSALRTGDRRRVEDAVRGWEPVVDLPLAPAEVRATIAGFGAVVDDIEERRFPPPSVAKLQQPARPNARNPFAYDVCRNCDGRYACPAWRQYQRALAPGRADTALYEALTDVGADSEREDWRDSALSDAPRRDDPGETP